jgi:hypothetical protein
MMLKMCGSNNKRGKKIKEEEENNKRKKGCKLWKRIRTSSKY